MKMLHVTIHTNHFEEEIAFYEKLVGLHIVNDMRALGPQIVFLANAEGETEIEIIAENSETIEGKANLSVGFKAENLDNQRVLLIKEGYEPTPIISPAPGVRFFFVKDPAGMNVQFM